MGSLGVTLATYQSQWWRQAKLQVSLKHVYCNSCSVSRETRTNMIFKDMFTEEVALIFKFQIIKSYCSRDGCNILNTQMPVFISSVVKKGRTSAIRPLWLASIWEKASLCQPSIHTPLCTVKCCFYARYPGQTFWRSIGGTDKADRVWWDTNLPFPSSTGMPLTVEWWMVTHACHTCDAYIHTRSHKHTHAKKTKKNIQETPLHQVSQALALHHTHKYTITQRQAGVLTVALQYSEPGVGGRGE